VEDGGGGGVSGAWGQVETREGGGEKGCGRGGGGKGDGVMGGGRGGEGRGECHKKAVWG